MRRFLIGLTTLALAGLAGFFVLTAQSVVSPGPAVIAAPASGSPDLQNGRTLFHAGGCASCHATPGAEDRTRMGGGLALASAFGVFHVPNISPHPRDGIGGWSEADFIRAMAAGVSPKGSHYYPAFPYTSYRLMPARDLRDLFAFIGTLPQVEGVVRDHELKFPFDLRRLVGGWKLLFFAGSPLNGSQSGPFQADAARSAAWNRGAYLVLGPGHCAECHSERNALGAIVEASRYGGGPDPEGKGHVPNITPHANGMATWSASEIAELLKSGFTPDFDSVGGSMASVVRNTSQLSEADRAAMAEYLKSLPPVAGRPRSRPAS